MATLSPISTVMTTPQVGQTIVARVKASTPAPRNEVVREGTVVAEFWGPGRDPQSSPEERERPDHVVECVWDDRSRGWLAETSTEGWEPGDWTVRGRVSGVTGPGRAARGWAWSRFTLAA